MAQEKLTTASQNSKIKLTGIFLEDEFASSRRCRELIADFGYEAYYALTILWGAFNKESTLTRKSLRIIAEPILGKKTDAFLDYCVRESLIDADNDSYFCSTIEERKHRRLAERARKRNGKTAEEARSAVLSLKSKVLDIKKEVSETDIATLAWVEIPEDLNFSAIIDWLNYKRERGQSYKPIGLQQLLNKWRGKNRDFEAAVKHSTANNYQGLFEPKSGSGPGRKLSTMELSQGTYQELFGNE